MPFEDVEVEIDLCGIGAGRVPKDLFRGQ
jgi:hypothetical protein